MNNLNWISARNPMTYEEVLGRLQELGVSLPEEYCHMIGPINGGALVDAFYEDAKLGKIAYSRNIDLSKKARIDVVTIISILNDIEIKYFPIASVGNGDYYCFNLKNLKIELFLHELQKHVPLCDSFQNMLNNLRCDC